MNPQSKKFLAEIQNSNADVRYAAWIRAGEMDSEVIPELGKLLTTAPPGVRRAAEEALKCIVHSVGKDPGAAKRTAVVKQLITLTSGGHATWTRTVALRHLSLIGSDETVPAAAKLLPNSELQEEAVFCLERIPGKAATQALMTALADASDTFKPRLLAALGHRRDEDATDACAAFVESKNMDLAIAAMKAVARIGKRPSKDSKVPDYNSLSDRQKIDYFDSGFRYADEQVRRGKMPDAIRLYEEFLNRPEEHLQCAAIIGLSKTNTPEAAALISTKLQSGNNTVRITAEKAHAAMAKKG